MSVRWVLFLCFFTDPYIPLYFMKCFFSLVYIFIGDSAPTDSKLFICEYHALTDLIDGLKTPCTCGMSSHPWIMDSVVQVHVRQNTHAHGSTSVACVTATEQDVVPRTVHVLFYTEKGHVIRLQFRCRCCHQCKRSWSSSRVLSGHYLVN